MRSVPMADIGCSRLVESVSDDDGNTLLTVESQSPISVISERTAETLKKILIETVQNGSRHCRLSRSVWRWAVKTGTAEDAGVWFAGFAPADEPQWAIAVYVSNGVSGGKEVAAVFTDIVDAWQT